MSVFWERYSELSTKKDGSPNGTAKILGFPSGSITAWSKDVMPVTKTIQKIAEYFGVSTDYLLGEDNPNSPEEQPLNESVLKILSAADGMSLDEINELLDFVSYIKSKRK
ncbi:MAG: helix-turn-helix domain-containing protein [Oscillospiraceae bacterium]|nr:helix-turn-helix domain-containing protein [Oscillospiraceae bacterium]